ncbi:TIGR04283 family arsenosugar biosynthesis glycosyltransferase [Methanoculleus oceani]|uniref:Glycosyl transferase n=1 Tax=Methanoculleus oceani TaxID=2184756 RepID=A0ABD4TFU6_9EURY|nr:TIGR04283 family arsenosugar biosynthesis glycosyltransferase [Methanoculleus sp. CWC-02]MCM2465914.1 glycosyl transferase [Methanoculleus sp. CWC-02]
MLSIITPVLNEEENIPGFLAHIDDLADPLEVIVVDGGSTDGTCRALEAAAGSFSRRIVVISSPAGRGVQMNAGARHATGTVLLFLHVDCRIPPDAPDAIRRALEREGVIGGGFRHAFTSRDSLLSLTSWFGNLLAARTQTFFGDFGIFIDKEAFFEIGGYEPLPYLEDVEFSRAARRHGRLVQVDRPIVVSPRRYLRKGKYRLSAVYILVMLLNMVGIRPKRFIRYVVEN